MRITKDMSDANASILVWDIRNAKKPVSTAYNLETVNPEANVIFSPDERMILTGNAQPLFVYYFADNVPN